MKSTCTLPLLFACLPAVAAFGCSSNEQTSSGAGGAGGEGGGWGSGPGSTAAASMASSGAGTTSSGAGTGGATGSSVGSGSSTNSSVGSGSSTTSSASGSGGGTPAVLPACWPTCASAADCAGPTPLTDADNYICNGGKCEYVGCNSTVECTSTYMNPNYVCTTLAGTSYKGCYLTCSSAADCAGPTPLTDADNYTCTGGVCEYLGCNSTAECTSTYMNPNYVCTTLPGLPLKSCYTTCSSAADCAGPTPLTDADNYACTGGICEYLGCNSTAECTSTYMNPNYICN